MKKSRVAAALFIGITSIAAAADARGAVKSGEDIITNGGIVADVFDTRFERDGGRDSDIDVLNGGRTGCIDAESRGQGDGPTADINCD